MGPSINTAHVRQTVRQRSLERNSASRNPGLEYKAPEAPRLARSKFVRSDRPDLIEYGLFGQAEQIIAGQSDRLLELRSQE